MTKEYMLWGSVTILVVFLLNQVVGRMIARAMSVDRLNVSRDEHIMCERHNQREFEMLRADIAGIRKDNEEGHRRIHEKLDKIISQNGWRINNNSGK